MTPTITLVEANATAHKYHGIAETSADVLTTAARVGAGRAIVVMPDPWLLRCGPSADEGSRVHSAGGDTQGAVLRLVGEAACLRH